MLETDATGRLKGDVPKGDHPCSVWSRGGYVASGTCNFTTDRSSGTTTSQKSSRGTSDISPPRTASEEAASSAVDLEKETSLTVDEVTETGSRYNSPRAILICLSGTKFAGDYDSPQARGAQTFGVFLADLFGLTGDGGDDGDGGDGNGN